MHIALTWEPIWVLVERLLTIVLYAHFINGVFEAQTERAQIFRTALQVRYR